MKNAGPPLVVAIGGFDPSCGAGVVADARSIEAMGALPVAVATAITVQSGTGVRRFTALPAARVLDQLDELLANLPVAAFKLGQVPTAAIARGLAARLAATGLPVVLDPVLVASGGGPLVGPGALEAIRAKLLPLVSLLTVNLAESAVLCDGPIRGLEGMRRAARRLQDRGVEAVLVKGGHLRGEPVDVLRYHGGEVLLRGRRLSGSMHGTGCALASAIAARLACGDALEEAVRAGRKHVRSLISGSIVVGRARLRAPALS